MPRKILIADSSQIDAYCTCPSMWNYGYRQSLALVDEIKDDIKMGTLGHKWLERYYSIRAVNPSLEDAVRHANAFDPDLLDEADAHEYPLDKTKRQIVIDRLQLYWMKYGHIKDFVPLTRQEHSIECINNELMDTYTSVPLVEQGFSYELLNTPEYLFILEGRIDILTEVNGSKHWVDHKFQTREHNLYPKSIQFRNYSLVTNSLFGVINYIRLHKEVKDSTLKREIVSFAPHELKVWKSELIDIFVHMVNDVANEAKQRSYAFERRRSSCPGKYGYPCQFTYICEEPSREVGELIKVQKYIKKKEWKPW